MYSLYTRPIRSFLCLLVPICLACQVQAQSLFSFTPTDTLRVAVQPNSFTVHYIYIENLSNDTLQLSWRLIDDGLPEAWEFVLCDNGVCYPTPAPTSGNFFPFGATEQAFIKPSIHPHNHLETGHLTYQVYPSDDPSQTQIMHFEFTPLGTTANQTTVAPQISVFPNPTTNQIHIRGLETSSFNATIYALSGKKIYSTTSTQTIDLQDIPAGFYILSIQANNTIYRKTIQVID